jgi:hypothetical protein
MVLETIFHRPEAWRVVNWGSVVNDIDGQDRPFKAKEFVASYLCRINCGIGGLSRLCRTANYAERHGQAAPIPT